MSGYAIIGDRGPFPAERDGGPGTVTMKEHGGSQWGDFHPGGDESVSIPIRKWDTETSWQEPCVYCGEPVTTCFANIDHGGPAHSGCMGYPYCSCETVHQGDCA